MQNPIVKLYTLEYHNAKTWLMASLFVIGNVVFPQLCHTIHMGGLIWLPIYFFTLVGAYKYGWKVGLLTAVISPLVNHLIFGMPPANMLAGILIKSVTLALAAGYTARRFKKVSIWLLCVVVLAYQTVGTLGEWAITDSLFMALQDFRIGIPGMLLQVFGTWGLLRYVIR